MNRHRKTADLFRESKNLPALPRGPRHNRQYSAQVASRFEMLHRSNLYAQHQSPTAEDSHLNIAGTMEACNGHVSVLEELGTMCPTEKYAGGEEFNREKDQRTRHFFRTQPRLHLIALHLGIAKTS